MGVQMSHSNAQWFLAQIKPNALARASTNLERQGFAPFAPYRNRVKRVGSRLRSVRDPLFPGYVFVRFDPRTTPWRKINSTYGVSRLVTLQKDTPTPVPPGLVEALSAHAGPDGEVELAPQLSVGDDVRVISGPFVDLLGRIEALSGPERVTVLLDMMGQSVRTKFRARDLERVQKKPTPPKS